jgi:hypothetical protein
MRRIGRGETILATARAFGVHPSTVQRRLRGVKATKRAPRAGTRTAASAAGSGKALPTAKAKGRTRRDKQARPSAQRAAPSALGVRRQLISRLYRAIDTKLKLMERRMHSEINAIEQGAPEDPAGLTAADHERETRAFGALVKTINSVRQMQAELEDLVSANPNTTAADARLAADADRYRRDIAQRLAKFVPPRA